ncbi:MAG TPA: DUF4124 domain-containing protein [Casimicrobiaceae bacterium]|nr:DUF4124 domain-containing protein [Casimicrobiaceae bacterium]
MNSNRIVQFSALPAIAFAWLMIATPASAATYKWVDEKGVVHYTDKMPPEAVNRGSVQLSKDGVPLKKVDPALTPEQLRAKEQEEERKRAEAKQREETARKDRALLASYTSENEIDLARQRALATIESALQSVNAFSEQIKKRQAEIKEKMASFKTKPVPPALEREYESLNEELDRQREVAINKRKEALAVNAKYEADKARWREIAANKAADAAAAAQNGSVVPAAMRK